MRRADCGAGAQGCVRLQVTTALYCAVSEDIRKVSSACLNGLFRGVSGCCAFTVLVACGCTRRCRGTRVSRCELAAPGPRHNHTEETGQYTEESSPCACAMGLAVVEGSHMPLCQCAVHWVVLLADPA